jgi:hypothetical protein
VLEKVALAQISLWVIGHFQTVTILPAQPNRPQETHNAETAQLVQVVTSNYSQSTDMAATGLTRGQPRMEKILFVIAIRWSKIVCLVYSYYMFVYKNRPLNSQESSLVNILFQYGVLTSDVGLFQTK